MGGLSLHVLEECALQVGAKFESVKERKAGATASAGVGVGGSSAKARPC